VATQLADKQLLKQFEEMELLSLECKHLVKTFIDAFITKTHVQELAKKQAQHLCAAGICLYLLP
jgi:hypothetical protein